MTIIFILSLLVLFFLLVVKFIESRKGSRTFVSVFIAKGDKFVLSVFKKGSLIYADAEVHLHKLFTHHIPNHGKNLRMKVGDFAESRKARMEDIMRGRKNLNSDGSVSFFLKNIGDSKSGR